MDRVSTSTAATAAGVADHVRTLEEVCALMEASRRMAGTWALSMKR